MNLSIFIAKRYFFSGKKKSFINLISIISMVVVATGTMALIIALSVFNGLEGLLRGLYSTVDPNIVIMPLQGKSFYYDQELKAKLEKIEGIEIITEVSEDNALIRYKDAQRVVRVKGVGDNFAKQGRLDKAIVQGRGDLKVDDINYAIIGRGIQYDLSVNPSNDFYALQIYYPRKDINPNALNPDKMLNVQHILAGGVFAIEKYYDENFVYVPIEFAEALFEQDGKRTSLELKADGSKSNEDLKVAITNIIGEDYKVLTNTEIHGDLYRILSTEKFFVFLVFSIIIAIASINIFFSLTMLVIDKKKDVAVLNALGASTKLVRDIFLFEGALVAFTGAFIGLALGLVVCFAQQTFGIISMGMQSAIMDAYPIKVELMDTVYTVLLIILIAFVSSVRPAIKASNEVNTGMLQ